MSNANTMPPAIAAAVCDIMKKKLTADRGEQDTRDGRAYSWASVDDIYEAVSAEMADAGLISEMIACGKPEWITIKDQAQGAERQALSLTYRFQITNKDGERYADPDNLWPVVAWFDGATTTAAARSLAHKQALRDLFKIKTVDVALAGASADIGSPSTRTTAERVLKPKRQKMADYTLTLPEGESATKRDEIIADLKAAAARKKGEKREIALRNSFRAKAGGIGRLTPADSAAITKVYSELLGEANAA